MKEIEDIERDATLVLDDRTVKRPTFTMMQHLASTNLRLCRALRMLLRRNGATMNSLCQTEKELAAMLRGEEEPMVNGASLQAVLA